MCQTFMQYLCSFWRCPGGAGAAQEMGRQARDGEAGRVGLGGVLPHPAPAYRAGLEDQRPQKDAEPTVLTTSRWRFETWKQKHQVVRLLGPSFKPRGQRGEPA